MISSSPNPESKQTKVKPRRKNCTGLSPTKPATSLISFAYFRWTTITIMWWSSQAKSGTYHSLGLLLLNTGLLCSVWCLTCNPGRIWITRVWMYSILVFAECCTGYKSEAGPLKWQTWTAITMFWFTLYITVSRQHLEIESRARLPKPSEVPRPKDIHSDVMSLARYF